MKKEIPICFQTNMLASKERTMMSDFEINLVIIQLFKAISARYLAHSYELCAFSYIQCQSSWSEPPCLLLPCWQWCFLGWNCTNQREAGNWTVRFLAIPEGTASPGFGLHFIHSLVLWHSQVCGTSKSQFHPVVILCYYQNPWEEIKMNLSFIGSSPPSTIVCF